MRSIRSGLGTGPTLSLLRRYSTQLNTIRRENAALQRNEGLHFHRTENEQVMCYSKASEDGSNAVLVVVNLDATAEQTAWMQLRLDVLGVPWGAEFEVEDLLTGAQFTWKEWCYVALTPELPAHVLRVVPPGPAALAPVA